MPIYEFKCDQCDELFEFLVVKSDDRQEMKCPKCGAEAFQRVLSSTHYAMGAGGGAPGAASGVSAQTRNCQGGSCTTWDLPGPTR